MSIEAITSIGLTESLVKTTSTDQVNFLDFLRTEISNANLNIEKAENNLQALAVGETDNLHQVMLSITKAQKSFELVVEVRNKLLEGYQEIMRTQV